MTEERKPRKYIFYKKQPRGQSYVPKTFNVLIWELDKRGSESNLIEKVLNIESHRTFGEELSKRGLLPILEVDEITEVSKKRSLNHIYEGSLTEEEYNDIYNSISLAIIRKASNQ